MNEIENTDRGFFAKKSLDSSQSLSNPFKANFICGYVLLYGNYFQLKA